MKDRDAVFRDVALRRLSVPDELTEVLSVTRPVDWLMLCALGLRLAAGLAWSALTSLKVTVKSDLMSYDGSGPQDAAIFITNCRSGQIVPGMTVRLAQSAADGQKARIFEGSVVRVSTVSRAVCRVDVALNFAGSLHTLRAAKED